MDPETLITFLFRAPREVRVVELLGSWDNFSTPYRMQLDRRRGNTCFSGCFTFENIIFDGLDAYMLPKSRSGGLKQGGSYWYFYRLDYNYEACDETEPLTTDCPLLPGQNLNVLEVPIERLEPPSRCASAGATMSITGSLGNWSGSRASTHTMDPHSKFAVLRPPPLSGVHVRCFSDIALGGRRESDLEPPSQHSQDSPPDAQHEHSIVERPSTRRSLPEEGLQGADDLALSPLAYSEASQFEVDASEIALPVSSSSSLDLQAGVVCEKYRSELITSASAFPPTDSSRGLGEGLHFDFHLAEEFKLAVDQSDHLLLGIQIPKPRDSVCDPRSTLADAIFNLAPTTESAVEVVANEETGSSALPRSAVQDSHPREFWSPTFSAATVSSNGGSNTPFRSCASQSQATDTHMYQDHANLDDVTKRLHALDTERMHVGSLSGSPIVQTHFSGYALPQMFFEDTQSLEKTTTSNRARAQYLPPPAVYQEGTSGSMIDDIFGELGYLGGSIL